VPLLLVILKPAIVDESPLSLAPIPSTVMSRPGKPAATLQHHGRDLVNNIQIGPGFPRPKTLFIP
jgi:hypothetical protein